MGFIKGFKSPVVWGAFLLVLFFTSRLFLLTNMPIFTDEAIYLRWAQIALNDPDWLFISLTDGKQPLFIWLAMGLMAIIKDPLFAGRLVSIVSGFIAMVGLFYLGKELFKSSKIGYISSFLYIIFPFSLVYDRMALYDSLVGAFAVWGIYLVVRLAKTQNLFLAILLGLEVGFSNLNKSNFFLTIILSPITFVLLNWQKGNFIKLLKKPISLIILSGAISFGIYSLLRISPLFYIIEQKNAVFIYPISEWLSQPFKSFIGNITALLGWFINYSTITLISFVILSFVVDKKFIKEKIVLLSWFVIPLVILSFVGRVIYPRYILFMVLPLLPLVAYLINTTYGIIKNKMIFVFIVIAFLFPLLRSDYLILTNFSKAPIPFTDKFQYYVGWPSGWGINESVDFFKNQSKNGPIFIGTEGTFGLLPFSYEIYLLGNSNVTTKGYWPITNSIPEELNAIKKEKSVYFVFYQPCSSCESIGDAPASWGLTKIASFPKGEANLTIYKLND